MALDKIQNVAGKEEKAAPVKAAEAAPEDVKANENLGSLRDKVAYVAALGDPSKKDTTNVVQKNGDKEVTKPIIRPRIVGYRLKILEDMQVPDCGTTAAFKSDAMNFADSYKWRQAKAGEVVDLTPYETALLLSQDEFSGSITGGEHPMTCVYNTKEKKGVSTGEEGHTSVIRVSLRAVKGSIKDLPYVPVLECEKVVRDGAETTIKKILPGFEKWAPFAVQAKRTSGKTAGTSANTANKMARQFTAMARERQAKAGAQK